MKENYAQLSSRRSLSARKVNTTALWLSVLVVAGPQALLYSCKLLSQTGNYRHAVESSWKRTR